MRSIFGGAALASMCVAAISADADQTLRATIVPGISVVAGAPGTSAVARDQAWVPPEPDAINDPRSHEGWVRALVAARDVSPTIVKRHVRHGPAKRRAASQALPTNAAEYETLNWSGAVITGAIISSLESISGTFTVPKGQQAFGTCDQDTDWVGLWVGIDGAADNSVLQGGVDVSATCTQAWYVPWIEWYPDEAVGFSSPSMAPGDMVFVEIWNTSPTQGWVLFYNYTTDTAAEYGVTAPAGTVLRGSSVEWIVERPGTAPALPRLANYIASAWPTGSAWNFADPAPTTLQMGVKPTPGRLRRAVMTDADGNVLSRVTIEGPQFLFFQSCDLAGSPC